MRNIRKHISRGTNECTFVDISVDSILSTVEHYPDILKWNEGRVELRDNTDGFFQNDYIEKAINAGMDKSVQAAVEVGAISRD
jgi:hypothetical protein